MTQAEAAKPATRAARRPWFSGMFDDLVHVTWTPLRVLLRHWPVLFSLAVLGLLAREGLIWAGVQLAGINAVLGFLVFLLAPVSVMIAMVLMLRGVRPSLPFAAALPFPPSVIGYVGSVLIPFVAFYLAFGFVEQDYRAYSAGLFGTYESWLVVYAGLADDNVRVEDPGNAPLLVGVVVVAFLLRRALDRWALTRRRPVFGLPGAYLETVWITLGLLWVVKPYVDAFWVWAEERKAWQAVVSWWDSRSVTAGVFGQVYRTVDEWFVATVPSGSVSRVFVVPLAGLAAAAVVYGLSVTSELRPSAGTRWRRFRWVVGGVTAAANRWFGPLILGLRAMARGGVLPLMIFCLAVVALQTAVQWLRKLEWLLIGPRESGSIQASLGSSLDAFNDVVTFVLLVCVLAAAADGVARRTARVTPPLGGMERSVRREAHVPGQPGDDDDADRDRAGTGGQGKVGGVHVP